MSKRLDPDQTPSYAASDQDRNSGCLNQLRGAWVAVCAVITLLLLCYVYQEQLWSYGFIQNKVKVLNELNEKEDQVLDARLNLAPKINAMYEQSKPMATKLNVYNNRLVIPPKSILEIMTRGELEELYHRYVENVQIACGSQMHYGLEADGGYYYCEDVALKPPCMMYSFGTRNDYSFDDKIANVIGCDVHSFDPGDGQKDHKRSERVWFHAIGLGGYTRKMMQGKGEWQIYSLQDVRKLLNHENRTLDILKIDTEGMIWETLVNASKPGVMDDVKLLIVELHINFPDPNLPTYRTKEEYIEHLESLKQLYDIGFRIYYFQRWHICPVIDDTGNRRTGCHDVHFIQINGK